MMDWVIPRCQQSVKAASCTLLILGCLATVGVARSWEGGKRSLRYPDTPEECENSDAAEVCINVQKQEQRTSPYAFCNNLMHGVVERTMRDCLQDMLQNCSEDINNREKDNLQNAVSEMHDMCYDITEDDYGENEEECNPSEVVECLQPLLYETGMQVDLMTGITLLSHPSAMAPYQVALCRSIDEVDHDEMADCLAEVDRRCTRASDSGRPPDSYQDQYNITQAFANLHRLCEPGCENLNDKINARDLCLENLEDTIQNCKQVEEGLLCAVDKTRCCSMLTDEFRKHLDQSNTLSQCPALRVDLSCHQGGGGGGGDSENRGDNRPADNYQGDPHQASTNGDSAGSSSFPKNSSGVMITSLTLTLVLTYLGQQFHHTTTSSTTR